MAEKLGIIQCRSLTCHEFVANTPFLSSIVKQTVLLFTPPLLWRTLQLFFLLTVCCSVNNVFLIWYPMMVNFFFNSYSTGVYDNISFCQRIVSNVTTAYSNNELCVDTISTNTIYSGIMLGIIFVTFNLAAAAVASFRRLTLISIFLVSLICMLLTDIIRQPIANLIIFTMIQSTAVGIGTVASYFVDLYPTSCRGLVTGLSMMVSRLVSLGGINVIGAVFEDHCLATFYFWAVVVGCGIAAAALLPANKTIKK